jgi:pimeloyl-ACP methyl ester carboxylesterase
MNNTASLVKPTIVLVHGAWHTADCWSLVTSQLKEYGYSFQAIQLPSAGGDLAITVEEDAAHIRKSTYELAAAGKDVILVLHSYGGIPGTESAKGLLKKDREAEQKSGGIISIVYITAFLLPLDASLGSFLGEMPPWVILEVRSRSRVSRYVSTILTSHCTGRENDGLQCGSHLL